MLGDVQDGRNHQWRPEASRSGRSKTAAFKLLTPDLSGQFLGPAEHFKVKLRRYPLDQVQDLVNPAWERQVKILFRQSEASLMTGNPVLIATRPPCPSLLLHVNAALIVRLRFHLRPPPLPLQIRLSSPDIKEINRF